MPISIPKRIVGEKAENEEVYMAEYRLFSRVRS